ncbi:MAG: C45 family autoproteolytic acyltransferase/hydrolase [Promethearchaeota archaeon]
MQVVKLSGNHHEMGVQQGKMHVTLLQEGIKTLKSLEVLEMVTPWWMTKSMFIRLAGWKAKKQMAAMMKRYAPNQYHRCLGIADGGGIAEWLVFLFSFIEISFGENDYEIPVSQGCTTIALDAALMETGHVSVARNFDYARFILPFLCIRKNEPRGFLKSMDITAAPLPGTFNGFNEEGVFISTNEAFPIKDGIRKPGLSASLMIQEALETCNTTQEVIDLFKKKPRGSCNIITVADKSGDLVSIEYTSEELHVVLPEDENHYLVATNHYITPELSRIDLPRNAVFGKKAPRSLQGVCINETSYVRRKVINDIIKEKKNEKLTTGFLQSILRDHSAGNGVGGMETICHHDPENITAASMIVDLMDKELWACFGSPCENEYERFSFD